MPNRNPPPSIQIMLNALHLCMLLGYDSESGFVLMCRTIHNHFWSSWAQLPDPKPMPFLQALGEYMPAELAQLVYDHGDFERKLAEVTTMVKGGRLPVVPQPPWLGLTEPPQNPGRK